MSDQDQASSSNYDSRDKEADENLVEESGERELSNHASEEPE